MVNRQTWHSFENKWRFQKKDRSNLEKPITTRPFLGYFFIIKKEPHRFLPNRSRLWALKLFQKKLRN